MRRLPALPTGVVRCTEFPALRSNWPAWPR